MDPMAFVAYVLLSTCTMHLISFALLCMAGHMVQRCGPDVPTGLAAPVQESQMALNWLCGWSVGAQATLCGRGEELRPDHSQRRDTAGGTGGALACRACTRHLFLTIPHPCLFLPPPPPPHQTIWSTFSLCLGIPPILCTQFMMMARVVVGSVGIDILCC